MDAVNQHEQTVLELRAAKQTIRELCVLNQELRERLACLERPLFSVTERQAA